MERLTGLLLFLVLPGLAKCTTPPEGSTGNTYAPTQPPPDNTLITAFSKATENKRTSHPRTSPHQHQHSHITSAGKVIETSTSFPPRTPLHQHQLLNTTPAETVIETSTSFPPRTPLHQHQLLNTTPAGTGNQITASPPPTTLQPHKSPTTTNIHTAIETSTSFPPRTPLHQHQLLNTTPAETVIETSTSFPPRTSLHQHQLLNTTPAGTETSPSVTSTSVYRNTASPSLIPTTTGSSSRHCQYFIRKQEDAVNIEVFNGNNEDNQSYSVILSSSEEKINFSIFSISFKTLKPCKNYTVSVNPNCTSNGSNTVMWNPFCPEFCSDIFENVDKLNWTKNSNMCFGNKTCLRSNDSSCSQMFTGTSCKEINLPPLEEPELHFERYKAILRWKNKNCNKIIKFNCTDLNDKTITENGMYKPYHNYSCVAMYPLLTKYITSESFPINFTCDWKDSYFPDLKPNCTDIEASWVHKSSNCNKNQIQFNIECEHNGDTSKKSKCRLNDKSCKISELNCGTKYTCNIEAFYNATWFNRTTKTVETLSEKPRIQFNGTTKHGNNGFIVRYKVSWRGPKGECKLHLKIGEKNVSTKSYKTEKDECVFDLEDLYHLTNYTFEVYAVNGKHNVSDRYKGSYSTHFNDRAVLGFLGFLIAVTSLALLFVMYKIFVLQRKPSSGDRCELDPLRPTEMLLHVEPIGADALIETYRKKIADDGRLFMEEFQSIPRIFSNYTVKEAKKSENQSKNRYVDILPYDYNRVALFNGGKHDYINASFIEGYKEPNKYIAAQGPKDETVEDFWRMVWEQKSSIIVMVTHCEEGNKSKCAQYWPSMERETELFDDFVVKIKHEKICPDYIVRQLSLMNRKEKAAERDVTHIQFVSWPDHGVPNEPSLLLKLRRRVNSFKNVFSGPIVVHCSAGVGRTGTYIGIDAMIESLEAEGRVDIYGYVAKLRRQRCLMVQVEAQYVLIHTALIEYNQFGETEISLASLHSTVNTLKQKEGNEPSLMDLEFQKLPKFKNWRSTNTAVAEENQKRNRSSVVPYDFNRVMIKLEEDEGHNSNNDDEDDYSSDEDDETCTKYINASYVDGYWSPRSLITAQGPLTGTVEDFLQMIHQKQVPAVVMLTDCMENGKEFCTQYWAEEKTVFGEMEVEVEETEITPTYVRRRLQIQSTKAKGSVTTEQYHFLKWAGLELPANPLDLIDMMKIIMQKSGHSNSRDNTNTPIVVHCHDGSSRSGIFCALWKLLFSGDTEKLVDVFQVVKGLRKDRLGMISTLEQYQFIYEALQAGFPVQNGEVKKTATFPYSVQVINEEGCTASADQQGAAKSQAPETDAVPESVIASPAPEEGTTESSCVPEKSPSESTTNGPTVTVEV